MCEYMSLIFFQREFCMTSGDGEESKGGAIQARFGVVKLVSTMVSLLHTSPVLLNP